MRTAGYAGMHKFKHGQQQQLAMGRPLMEQQQSHETQEWLIAEDMDLLRVSTTLFATRSSVLYLERVMSHFKLHPILFCAFST